MREIIGYDMQRPEPIRWRMALLLALAAALAGCADRDLYQFVRQPADRRTIPCNTDNCGKRP